MEPSKEPPKDPPERSHSTVLVPDTPLKATIDNNASVSTHLAYHPGAETQPVELSFDLSYADAIVGPCTLSSPGKAAHPPLNPTRPRPVPSASTSAATPADDPDVSHFDCSQLSPTSQQSPRARNGGQTSFSQPGPEQECDLSQSQVNTIAAAGPAHWEHVVELSEVQEEMSVVPGEGEELQAMERELNALQGGPPPLPGSFEDEDVDELEDSIQDADVSTLPAPAPPQHLSRPSPTPGPSLPDDSQGPSSSPFVANLLQSKSPGKKRPFAFVPPAPDSPAASSPAPSRGETEVEPQSSADDFSTSLLRPEREPLVSHVEVDEGGDERDEGDLSALDLEGDAGPVVSSFLSEAARELKLMG